MSNIVGCYIIIKDDFNNVLIVQRGKNKKDEIESWQLFSRVKKGKETDEKCLAKLMKEELKTIIFDLNLFKEHKIDEEGNVVLVYDGKIREEVSCKSDVNKVKWINERAMSDYIFENIDKELLTEFFQRVNEK